MQQHINRPFFYFQDLSKPFSDIVEKLLGIPTGDVLIVVH